MELGIAGRSAIVCAASQGLGRGAAFALAREGVNVTINARRPAPLEETAEAIRSETGVHVTAVVGDITTEEGRAAVLAACPEPDILVNNAGGAPPGDFRDWSREDWIAAFDGNALAAIFMIKATVDGMIERRFGRIVNITNFAIKGGFPDLGLSVGAVSALTGFVGGLARQTVRHHVTINNLVPGRFDTDRLRSNMEVTMRETGRSLEDVRAERVARVPAGRLGDPAELGHACAYLCSTQAGYITGQNVVFDGGEYPGTF